MKIQIKTINSYYDEQIGYSRVTIATDLGEFEGHAQLHPEDAEIASRYAGCRYAEMRASIKYMKTKAKIEKAKLEPLYKILNEIKNKNNYNENNIGVKLLKREIYVIENDLANFKDYANSLQERLNNAINSRPDIVKDMIKRKQDNK